MFDNYAFVLQNCEDVVKKKFDHSVVPPTAVESDGSQVASTVDNTS